MSGWPEKTEIRDLALVMVTPYAIQGAPQEHMASVSYQMRCRSVQADGTRYREGTLCKPSHATVSLSTDLDIADPSSSSDKILSSLIDTPPSKTTVLGVASQILLHFFSCLFFYITQPFPILFFICICGWFINTQL